MSLKQPVQYPVKYYSHLDAGAPQLANVDGNIKSILKAGLVTGIGVKEGAGWTALFEDNFRIVLRRPLRTGNPPDIKIENGVINGTASHRIISQDNPTGLDDSAEIAAVNLLARDSVHGNEWHLIVSDFGFIFCYQMGRSFSGDRNYVMYVGEAQSIDDDAAIFFATKNNEVGRDGTVLNNQEELFSGKSMIVNMRNGNQISLSGAGMITVGTAEKTNTGDYIAQKAILPLMRLTPFYLAITKSYNDKVTKTVSINGRQMLRYVNIDRFSTEPRALYIPLDYWEL